MIVRSSAHEHGQALNRTKAAAIRFFQADKSKTKPLRHCREIRRVFARFSIAVAKNHVHGTFIAQQS